jgi:histidine triad (HIT) family protein
MIDCIFCKILAGQIKADVVFEDQHVMAFRDLNPQAPIHILIVPKQHIERVAALTGETLHVVGEIHRAAQSIAKQNNVLEKGFRLITNSGPDAGQTVNHLHYHFLAGQLMSWRPA